MYIPISSLEECRPLFLGTRLCTDIFAYPIDNKAICEAQILRNTRTLPENCQSVLIFAKGYNVHKLTDNLWLIINSEPLQITINCQQRSSKTEVIFKNSILKLQPGCNAFIGVTKVQANMKEVLTIHEDSQPIVIPFDCCEKVPDDISLPKLKPLKLNNLNLEDLEIAKHKLDEYSKSLDDLINEPFVSKHISWFTYFTIILITTLILLYILCKCRKKRRLAIAPSTSSPPSPPPTSRKSFRRLRAAASSMLIRGRPSIRTEDIVEDDIEMN